MKKKLIDKIVKITFPIVGTIFIGTTIILLWDYIIQHAKTILIASGSIILIYALLGYFKSKKFIRGFKKRF